jgi:cysteinyl-tRNA synthetase
MTIRFFILQAHYRGTVDFSNEALQSAEKALARMLEGYRRLADLKPSATSTLDTNIADIEKKCYESMDDDFNTPMVIANLFDACRLVNQVNDGKATATAEEIEALKALFNTFLVEILGVKTDLVEGGNTDALKPFEDAIDLLLDLRREAKARKDWAMSDLIRDRLAAIGFEVKDTKDGFEWSLKK